MTRRALKSSAEVSGVGLFSGSECSVRIRSAEAGTGVLFLQDGSDSGVAAHVSSLDDQPIHPAFAGMPPRNTNLRDGARGIATVEHILSALAGLGVTDAVVEISGPEIPIGDGSAAAFASALDKAGLVDIYADAKPIVANGEFTVSDGDTWIRVEPSPGEIEFTYELDYGPTSPIKAQSATWRGDAADYVQNIAPARTFSLKHEAEAMHAMGLFTAFTPRDLLVVGEDGPIDNEWRFENEAARHKLLDLIGDLSLSGAPIQARVIAHRSGHALNHEVARRLAAL